MESGAPERARLQRQISSGEGVSPQGVKLRGGGLQGNGGSGEGSTGKGWLWGGQAPGRRGLRGRLGYEEGQALGRALVGEQSSRKISYRRTELPRDLLQKSRAPKSAALRRDLMGGLETQTCSLSGTTAVTEEIIALFFFSRALGCLIPVTSPTGHLVVCGPRSSSLPSRSWLALASQDAEIEH